MIMPRGQQLLLPAKARYIWGSIVVAFGLNMWFNMGLLGRASAMPDLLALVLVFWTIHQPQRVGMSAAFIFGLLMDVHESAILGQHALAYSVLSFLAIGIHRRLLWFSVPKQAAQVLPLFLAAHLIVLLTRLISGASSPGWWFVFAPLLEALLWPLISVVLLLPQRQAPNPDANRPL